MQPGGNALGLPEAPGETPAVQRSVETGVPSGVLDAAGGELGELTPPGTTPPQDARIQANAHKISNGLNREPPTEEAPCLSSRVRSNRL
jgi:hypothetical protein